jgi:hypothetical protein
MGQPNAKFGEKTDSVSCSATSGWWYEFTGLTVGNLKLLNIWNIKQQYKGTRFFSLYKILVVLWLASEATNITVRGSTIPWKYTLPTGFEMNWEQKFIILACLTLLSANNAYIQTRENRFQARKEYFLAFLKWSICFSLRDHVRTKTFHHQPADGAEYTQTQGHFFPFVWPISLFYY